MSGKSFSFSSINKLSKFSARAESDDSNKGYTPRVALTWTEELSCRMIKFFKDLNYPYRIAIIPSYFNNSEQSEIRRFLLSLDAYLESPNPVMTDKEILYGSALKDYASNLKKIKTKSIILTWESKPFIEPSWWKKTDHYIISDIGDIFNFSYLPFFLMDDDEDYKNGNLPLSLDNDTLKQFEDYFREILPPRNNFDKIDPLTVLLELKGTRCLNKKLEKSDHYKEKGKNLRFSKSRGLVQRVVIPVSPNNNRDSILNQIEDLNTITLIDRQCLEILSAMPGHIHLRDSDRIYNRLTKLKKKNTYFLMRDLKKEGLTKPRALLKIMLKVLNEEFPDLEIFENYEFYDKYRVKLNDNTIYEPVRGHGLGMANSLTSFMQLAVHRMVLAELYTNLPKERIDILVLNDDFVVGCKIEDYIDEYWTIEEGILNNLGLIRHPEKSFRTKDCFVIAENYFFKEIEYKKESYILRELYMPLACANIVHAKNYVLGLNTNHIKFEEIFREIVSYWGYEFFPEEVNYPSIFGGWHDPKLYGINLSLLEMEKLPFKSYISGAYAACKYNFKMRGKLIDNSIFDSPVSRLMNFEVPSKYNQQFDIGTNSEIRDKYRNNLSQEANHSYFWEMIKSKRKSLFLKPNRRYFNFNSMIKDIIVDYKKQDFFPIKLMIKKEIMCNICDYKFRDPYIDPNPKTALIAYYNHSSYPFKERYSIEFLKKDSSKNISSHERNQTFALNNSDLIFLDIIEEGKKTLIPRFESIESIYLNPLRVGMVSHHFNDISIPIIYDEYINPMLELKEEVYGRFLSLDERELFNYSKFSREFFKDLISSSNVKDEGIYEHIGRLFQEFFPDIEEENTDLEDKSSVYVKLEVGTGDHIPSGLSLDQLDDYVPESERGEYFIPKDFLKLKDIEDIFWRFICVPEEYTFERRITENGWNSIRHLNLLIRMKDEHCDFNYSNDDCRDQLKSYGDDIVTLWELCKIFEKSLENSDIFDLDDEEFFIDLDNL